MRRIIFISALAMSLAACTTLSQGTPSQRLYEAISNYKQAQSIAVVYKQKCDTKLAEDICKQRVEVIRAVNNKANLLIQSVNATDDGVEYISSITTALVVVTSELIKSMETK